MNRDWIFYFCLFTVYLVNQSRLLEWNVKRLAWFSNLFSYTKSTPGFLIRGVNAYKQKVDVWHTGPVLKSLHSVPVPFVIDFKILLARALIALLVINPLFIRAQPEGLWMGSAGCSWAETEDGGVTVLPRLLDSGTTCQRSTGWLNQYHRLNHFSKHTFIERLFFKFKFRKSMLILYCFHSSHTVFSQCCQLYIFLLYHNMFLGKTLCNFINFIINIILLLSLVTTRSPSVMLCNNNSRCSHDRTSNSRCCVLDSVQCLTKLSSPRGALTTSPAE